MSPAVPRIRRLSVWGLVDGRASLSLGKGVPVVGLTVAGSLASRVIADGMSIYRRKFPRTVRVETTNHCQAACTFCPRESIGRPKTFMKQELFEKVVRECAA